MTKFQRLLQTTHYGRVIITTESSIPSTQDVLRGIPFRAPFNHGTVILSNGQTNGRGRGGTKWESNSGSLCFSHECRIAINLIPFVQYISALAITQCFGYGKTRIKWPNDVVCNKERKKIAGVLCEGFVCGDLAVVIVGVGINIGNNDVPANATSLSRIDCEMSRTDLLASYCNKFEMLLNRLNSSSSSSSHGFEAIRFIYLDRWLHSNQTVYLEDDCVFAKIIGIAQSGAVLVRKSDGSLRELPPDVTSLDLDAGVLRKKVAVI